MTNKDTDVVKSDFEIRALNQAFAVVNYSPDGNIQGANYRFLRLVGYELDDLIGLDASMFLSSTSKRNEQVERWNRLRQGDQLQETTLWITKQGREVWLASRFIPIASEEGEIQSVVQIAEDVTLRQQLEAENRGQIEAIQQSQGVVQFSLDGIVLSANDLFLEAMGYMRHEVLGRHHSMFMDPLERNSEKYAAFWAALANGEHRSGEFRRISKNGADVWLRAVYSPILDPAGRTLKIVKYATDVTTDKVRSADYQWQVTAIHKSNSVVTFDMYGTVLDANDLFLNALGYTLEEIRGRHHKIFVNPIYAHSVEYASFWSDLRSGKHRAGQYKRYGKDGREIWLQATYNPIFDATGKPVKIVEYASVVTEERLLQAEHQGQIAAINEAQCVISFELDGTVIDANENFLDAMGYRFNEVRGMHHRIFVEPSHAETDEYKNFWAGLAAGQHRSGEFRRLTKDGREIWLQATYNPIQDLDGRIFKVVKYATDITAERIQQADYQGQIEAINKSQDVIVFAMDGTIIDVNDNFLTTLGYERADLIGKCHSMLVPREVVASAEYHEFWDKLRSGAYQSGLHKRVGKHGKEVWIQASYNPILDLNGKPSRVVKYATDVSSNIALAEAFDEAKRQAHHDTATSLPNRAKLSSFMNNCLVDPSGAMTVLYIDVDRFKPINDTFGHHVGDKVLGEVADRMRRVIRGDQMVARVGGDEFVIAAPGMQLDSIERFCKKLYEQVTAPIRHDDGDISVGISVGIAVAPADGSTPDELLRAADAALYRSKQNGRGIYSYFSSDLNDRINGQRKLMEEMRNSLTAGDFYLEYQPRFDTHQHTVRSAEALVRWSHPERGRISPADFIPVAEQSGLIVPLGNWILRTACLAATRWGGIGVSVNISPVQFRDGNLTQRVNEALTAAGLAPELLELEITEGVLLEDASRAAGILNELKALGVKLAMDDFGTGYSSLSYLRNFPFDVIKIDRSFVMDLETRDTARPIVQAVLGLGRALGLSVTAEGVETDEQLNLLVADRCDEVQGFLMAKPIIAEELEKLLASPPKTKTTDEKMLRVA